ncbi:MAG: cytidylate kinase-like family protein [Actinomycetota bacterium]|nr:cytidylate kinase-like family protein [Actinomycetota bacterium]
MGYKVVCISSQDGAHAREVSRRVAEALGFRLIDEDIIADAAVEAGVDKDTVADVERRKSAIGRLMEKMAAGAVASAPVPPGGGMGPPASDELRKAIRSAIDESATSGNAVLVSHAASYALADRSDVLRVLVIASEKTRRDRIAAERGVDDAEAGRMLKRSDAGRADYLKRFYGVGEEQPVHYDLVVNTDKFSAEDAGRLIVDSVRSEP